MNIEEIKKQLTENMVALRSVEHNASFAKAAAYIDYALKELKSATSQKQMPSSPAITDAVKVEANAEEDSDEANNTPSDDDYEISQAGGANPADEASGNFNTAYNNIAGNIGNVETSANSNIRESNLSDVQNLGADSLATIKGLNTNLQTLTDVISAQAIEDLNNAGELSARDKYDTAQLAREAGQARGNIAGNSTVYNELLNAENLKDERQQDAVALATTAAQLEDGYNSDALNLITGQSNATSLAVSPAATTSGYVNPITYNPYTNAYAQDLYNTNYNAAWDQYYKEGNKWENLIGGTIGLGGTLAGGFFGGPAGAEIGGKTGMAMGSSIGSMF